MHLYLMQHGEAVPPEQDPARPLSDKGRQDVERLAAFLAERKVALSRVVHSGKLRARQTAEILVEAVAPAVRLEEIAGIAPMDPVEDFAAAVAARDSDSLVVGHLPFMEKLTSYLVVGNEDTPVIKFQNGAVVCLDLDREVGSWVIKWALSPKLNMN